MILLALLPVEQVMEAGLSWVLLSRDTLATSPRSAKGPAIAVRVSLRIGYWMKWGGTPETRTTSMKSAVVSINAMSHASRKRRGDRVLEIDFQNCLALMRMGVIQLTL